MFTTKATSALLSACALMAGMALSAPATAGPQLTIGLNGCFAYSSTGTAGLTGCGNTANPSELFPSGVQQIEFATGTFTSSNTFTMAPLSVMNYSYSLSTSGEARNTDGGTWVSLGTLTQTWPNYASWSSDPVIQLLSYVETLLRTTPPINNVVRLVLDTNNNTVNDLVLEVNNVDGTFKAWSHGFISNTFPNNPNPWVRESDFRVNLDLQAIPEPASLALVAVALAGMGLARRRRTN